MAEWTAYVGKPSLTIQRTGNRLTAYFNVDALRILGAKRDERFKVSVYFKGSKCMVVRADPVRDRHLRQ